MLVGIALLFAGTQTARPEQPRQLTLAERVAYQYAIEEVYWRHRIWPKENPRPKPSLDEVMSPAQVVEKVNEYLRNSQLLADWRQPITPNELQTEMERVASHTKQPEVLSELVSALGNDPVVIAECLARPILGERIVADLTARDRVHEFVSNAELALARAPKSESHKLQEIFVPLDCDNSWTTTTTTNAPAARYSHTAVWTGSEMIVWGGIGDGTANYVNTGATYNPTTDAWIATSTTNAPSGRYSPTAVWTGREMIIWGGIGPSITYLNTGGRYDVATDSWMPTSTNNAPQARASHTAVWTGDEMIVWGGVFSMNSGGKYNPHNNTWASTSTISPPEGRSNHTAVWIGTEMIVWGGYGSNNTALNTGARYDPSANVWAATAITKAPAARYGHRTVWTGSEMIVWGGSYFNGQSVYLDSGGRYNPNSDSWMATTFNNAPAARTLHTAVWTGTEMIVWGGFFFDYAGTGNHYLNTGGRYNPATNSWILTTTANAPQARQRHTALWTGNRMMVWGGERDTAFPLNTGGPYCAQPSTPIVYSVVSRRAHGGADTFDVDLPVSGTPGIESRNGGATSDYTVIVSFLANVSIDGNPQALITSGAAVVGSGGMSNGGIVTIAGNVVTVPLTNVTDAQTINVTLNNVNGSTNLVIPMSVLIGDVNGDGTVNASDVVLTKSHIGQPVSATNFRADVNASGAINATDVSIVKSYTGTGLP